MSGFPNFEPYEAAQLLIVHMDDSRSEIIFGGEEESQIDGFDGYRWETTRQGLSIHRFGAVTHFPWATVKSYTLVYPGAKCESCEDLTKIKHLDPDNEGDKEQNTE